MKHLLAVYGTLKKNHGNNRLLSTAKFLGDQFIPGFKMHSLGGFPAITKTNDDSEIKIEVYEVTDPDVLARVYGLEGYTGQRDHSQNWYDTLDVETKFGVAEVFYMKQEITNRPIVPDGVWR